MNDLVPATPVAMWRSVTDRAKRAAKERPGRSVAEIQRQYVYERLLARIFRDLEQPWVLKGGTALLMRVQDARHSKDVDLLHTEADLDAATEEVRRAVAEDLGDWMRFTVVTLEVIGGDGQPGVQGRRIGLDAYCGTSLVHQFHADVVVGSLMTADPDTKIAPASIRVPGIEPPTLRLYPVVDHVADKVCATEAGYGRKPSSRARDLVDIDLIACTQVIDGTQAQAAIVGERTHRGLPARGSFEVPREWARQYRRVAEGTPCPPTFGEAVALARSFVEPVLRSEVDDRVWSPRRRSWGRPDVSSVPGTS